MSQVRLVSQTAVVGNSLYIIGGWDPGHKRDGGDILSDIWKLDLETYAWEEVHPQVPSSSAHTILLSMETWSCDGDEVLMVSCRGWLCNQSLGIRHVRLVTRFGSTHTAM